MRISMTRENVSVDTRIAVRRPVPQDWPRILEILASANFHRIGCREMEKFPLEDAYVSEVENRVAGVCGYQVLNVESAKTTLMVVDPAYRGMGLGTALHEVRMDYLRGLGLRYLYTNCDDEEVISWIERRFGYRRTGGRVPKTEDFGLPGVREWVTLRCDLRTCKSLRLEG
jgi:GNAT superfamily N-acetyltransferase